MSDMLHWIRYLVPLSTSGYKNGVAKQYTYALCYILVPRIPSSAALTTNQVVRVQLQYVTNLNLFYK
jgi:hypothetical protein